MSLPRDLVVPVLERIVEATGGVEVHGADGGPFLTLTAADGGGPGGSVRLFESPALPRLVYCNLDLAAHDLDSHMLYGFAPAASGVPHFTVDAVDAHGVLAFHADLMPRVDLATHVPYMNAVLTQLDDAFAAVQGDDAFLPAMLSPRQRALMSPWMLANRLTRERFDVAEAPVRTYVEHWLGLVVDGADEAAWGLGDTDLPARDASLRRTVFGGDVDPAWDMAAKAVGAEPIRTLRGLLVGTA